MEPASVDDETAFRADDSGRFLGCRPLPAPQRHHPRRRGLRPHRRRHPRRHPQPGAAPARRRPRRAARGPHAGARGTAAPGAVRLEDLGQLRVVGVLQGEPQRVAHEVHREHGGLVAHPLVENSTNMFITITRASGNSVFIGFIREASLAIHRNLRGWTPFVAGPLSRPRHPPAGGSRPAARRRRAAGRAAARCP
jgi:hypothetical protein